MSDTLNKATVLVLNRHWQAIHVRTPAEASARWPRTRPPAWRSFLIDHIMPRPRGGPNSWENGVWASRKINTRKGNRLPREAGLRLLAAPRVPKELPVTLLIRNVHRVTDWRLFVQE